MDRMFVIVKNHATGRIRKTSSNELYCLDVDNSKYWPFKPESEDGFSKSSYYGEIVNDNIVLNSILTMSRSEEYISQVFDAPRQFGIKNPKRFSYSSPCLPLKQFKLAMERNNSKDSKKLKTTAKISHTQKEEDRILQKYHAKQAQGKEERSSQKPKSEASTSMHAANNPSHELKRKSQCLSISDRGHEIKKPRCEECPSLRDRISQLEKETQLFKCELCPNLRKRIIDLEQQLQNSKCEECPMLKEKVATLEVHNVDLNDQLLTATKQISDLESQKKSSEMVSSEIAELQSCRQYLKSMQEILSATQPGCSLANLQSAFSNKTSAVNSAVSDINKIDCGENIEIDKADVAEVEIKSGKFSARVLGLCELYWPQKVHEMHLGADFIEGKQISETHIESLKTILNTFEWEQEEVLKLYQAVFTKRTWTPDNIPKTDPITKSLVRYQLRKTTYNARDVLEKSKMTQEEKQQLREKKKAPKASTVRTKKVKEDDKSKKNLSAKVLGQTVQQNAMAHKEEALGSKKATENDDKKDDVVTDDKKDESFDEYIFVNNVEDNVSESESSFLAESPMKMR